MSNVVNSFLKKMGLYHPYRNWSVRRRQARELRAWERGGRVAVPAPHLVKQQTLKEYAGKYSLKSLVETGTLHGDMIEAMKGSFEMVYSIELSRELYKEAKDRFRADSNVELIQGDSGEELASLVTRLKGPALFWLDGHYSGGDTARGEEDTPIYKELGHILDSGEVGHVIIIDDARCFGTESGYPTIEELKEYITAKRGGLLIELKGDSIRITHKDIISV